MILVTHNFSGKWRTCKKCYIFERKFLKVLDLKYITLGFEIKEFS